MTAVIFVGPTLRSEDVASTLDAVCLPPAAKGDVYRAALGRPRAIGIIDGYFSGAPSVWHKEILWALSQGVHVFGAASMGALRAAELHPFGMRGIGRIFEAYVDGTLEDDDEVAVIHGPGEIGYLPLSDPMANIRSTLSRAEVEGALTANAGHALTLFAKSLHFSERCWPALLAQASNLGISDAEVVAFRDWLPGGCVDQKRLDALEMLVSLRETVARGEAFKPGFRFEWTHLWDEFVFSLAPASATTSTRAVLEELQIEGPAAFEPAEWRALLRASRTICSDRVSETTRQDLLTELSQLRERLGLFARADLDRWMAQNEMDEVALERMLRDEVSVKVLRERIGRSLEPYLIDDLRLSGDYSKLAQRARAKQAALVDAPASTPLTQAGARLWYFERALCRAVPEDIEAFAHRLGFQKVSAFDEAVFREWSFLRSIPNERLTQQSTRE